MRTSACLLITILALLSPSCDKDSGVVEFQRLETQCADPWYLEEPDLLTEPDRSLQSYLTRRGVRVFDIRYEVDPSVLLVCEACSCGTGRTIIVTVPESEASRMQDLGFER